MHDEQPREEELFDAYLTAQHTVVIRERERGGLLRGGYSRNRPHLRVLRRQVDEALFAPLSPALDAPAPLLDAPLPDDEIAHFFHDMRNNVQAAILAAAGLTRDLPPERRERYLRALCRSLTNLTEDLNVLDPVEDYRQLPVHPALTLVPPPATRADSDASL